MWDYFYIRVPYASVVAVRLDNLERRLPDGGEVLCREAFSGAAGILLEGHLHAPVAVHLGDDSDLTSFEFRKFHIPCLPQTSDCLL